jgi:hypothetical protein
VRFLQKFDFEYKKKLLEDFKYRRVSNYCLLETLDVMTAARLSTKTDDGSAVLISNNKILRETDLDNKDQILSSLSI